ncbi:TerB family tellurite resistance protein [Candidatus Pelagibacter sp.]|nr:TerB family tellurite resistance protein [Candidatus Pelagibacter sp.]|tara:strand:- start:113 stop:532 length:420 start_codon:yes stop_codon:yes gene_type:complete
MLNFLKKNKDESKNTLSVTSLACLLIHAAKIDENYSSKEKKIIEETLIKLGVDEKEILDIMNEAEILEKNSNQIIDYTKEAKNLKQDDKLILIEALWSIIYSDNNADMYEANLMRRLAGLIYLDNKIVGDIKEKIKKNL